MTETITLYSEDLLGDTLMQTPALAALKASLPHATIRYVSPPTRESAQVLRHNPAIDELVTGDCPPEARILSASASFVAAAGRPLAEGYARLLGFRTVDPAPRYYPTPSELRAGQVLAKKLGRGEPVVVIARHSRSCTSQAGLPANKMAPNDVWLEVADGLLNLGVVPVAIGAAVDAKDARYANWPGPKLYGAPIRQVAGFIRACQAVLSVECGILLLATAVGADVYVTNTGLPASSIPCPPVRPGQRVILDSTHLSYVSAGRILSGYASLIDK